MSLPVWTDSGAGCPQGGESQIGNPGKDGVFPGKQWPEDGRTGQTGQTSTQQFGQDFQGKTVFRENGGVSTHGQEDTTGENGNRRRNKENWGMITKIGSILFPPPPMFLTPSYKLYVVI